MYSRSASAKQVTSRITAPATGGPMLRVGVPCIPSTRHSVRSPVYPAPRCPGKGVLCILPKWYSGQGLSYEIHPRDVTPTKSLLCTMPTRHVGRASATGLSLSSDHSWLMSADYRSHPQQGTTLPAKYSHRGLTEFRIQQWVKWFISLTNHTHTQIWSLSALGSPTKKDGSASETFLSE